MPEVRLCDKDAEIKRIQQYCIARECKHKYWSVYCKACEVADMIDEFESAAEVEAEPVRHGKGCSYCKGRAYSKKPLTVITRTMKRVEVVFEFCPACGKKMNVTDTNVGRKGGADNG